MPNIAVKLPKMLNNASKTRFKNDYKKGKIRKNAEKRNRHQNPRFNHYNSLDDFVETIKSIVYKKRNFLLLKMCLIMF